MIFLMLRNARRVEKAMSPILQGIQGLSRGSYQPLGRTGGTGGDQRGAETGPGIT